MAEYGARYLRRTGDVDEERTVFSVKRFPKYGTSNSNHSLKTLSPETYDRFVKHTIGRKDTLNSIALKYGLKTSMIKQVNRLWDDSIFFHDFLLIPIINTESLPPHYDGEILNKTEALKILSRVKKNNDHAPTSSGVESTISSSQLTKKGSSGHELDEARQKSLTTTDDYFSKFDSSISKIKSNLEKLENESRSHGQLQKSNKVWHSKPVAIRSCFPEPSMKFSKNPDGSSEAKLQEKFERLENEMFQL